MGEISKSAGFKVYATFDEAVRSLIKPDKEFIIVQHTLQYGKRVRPHFHRRANEWVIFDRGRAEIEIGSDCFEVVKATGNFIVVPLPRGKIHSLVARSRISYFVLRDTLDVPVWGRKPR